MELVYSITPSDHSSTYTLGHSGSSVTSSAWSSNNLLAFSWEKVVKGYIERYVSIIDPNQPWNVFAIPFKTSSVRALKWSQSGKKIFCVTSNGLCSVWGASKNLTNVWKEASNFSSDLHGEDILAASWLSDGRKTFLHLDKLKDPKEKVTRSYKRPTLAQLGGQPMEGYIIVTSSGMVAVKCLTQNEQPVFAKAELQTQTQFQIADIAHSNNGQIVVLASDGFTDNEVHFWNIEFIYDNETGRLSLNIDKMQGITLQCNADNPGMYPSLSHARFVSSFNAEHVLLCASNASGSILEAWLWKEYKDPPTDLHSIFVPQTGLTEKIARWKHVPSAASPLPKVLDLLLPQTLVPASGLKSAQEVKLLNLFGLVVLTPNNTVKILNKITLAEMLSFHIPENVTNDDQNALQIGKKRSRKEDVISNISHVTLSPMCCAMAVFDDHANLLMYRVAPWLQNITPDPRMSAHHVMHLLYYCVFTGQEWWDVLLHMQGNIVNTVCENLTQEFSHQPQPLQQMLKSRLLAVKISIYQRAARDSKAIDCHLRLMFEAIVVVFRSLLRLPQNSQEDQAPADKLHEACSASFETDISKLLQSVDTDQRTLQSLQQLIQWVADVTLYLLAIVPQVNSRKLDMPGASLALDKEFLAMLRELLVILQMWRLLKSACAPVFCSLDDRIDGLPYIFKLLTEVLKALSTIELQGRIPDNIIDECSTLSNQIIIPALDVIRPVNGVLQRLETMNKTLRFEFNSPPHNIQSVNKFADMHFLKVDDVSKIDNLRRVHLGVSPTTPLKICSRCGIVSVLTLKQDSMIEFWDQRFTAACVCGGSWQRLDNLVKK